MTTLHFDDYFEKSYLLPQEALVFGYRCYTNDEDKDKEDLTAAIRDNTAAMPYFDYNTGGVTVGNSTISGSNEIATDKNDGECTVLDNSTAKNNGFTGGNEFTQWLSSTVRVQHGNIVPGITKSVASVKDYVTGDTVENLTQLYLYCS